MQLEVGVIRAYFILRLRRPPRLDGGGNMCVFQFTPERRSRRSRMSRIVDMMT